VNKLTKVIVAVATVTALTGTLAACTSEADTVEHNLTKEADDFGVLRRIVFFNGITDTYLLELTGFCSITDEGNQLEVICKVGDDKYEKHMLGLSDNVSYFAEQLEASSVDPYHYTVVFRPETIIPAVDLQTSGG
jgi:hypothetical protein